MKTSSRTAMPTIRDVARLAGVSHMTVSRVINRELSVRPATRELVEQAIRALNFSPNPSARALSGPEQGKVAMLHRFPNMANLGEFLGHLLEATTRAHVTLVVRKIASAVDDEQAVRDLIEEGVRAVVLTPPLADDARLVTLLREAGMALVAAGSTRSKRGMSAVGIDERAAARAMTEHVIGIGHRRIGFITGHPSHASSHERLEGYRAALEAAGLPFDPELTAQGRYDYLSGLEAAEQLLGLPTPPTAIFASNDDMAAATVSTAHRRGLDVPADLTVCGFDDTALATTIWPALTTVRQPVDELTRQAIELVLRERAARPPRSAEEQRVALDHVIVHRQSEAPPRRPRARPRDEQAASASH